MLSAQKWGAGHSVRRLGELLAERGYTIAASEFGHGVVATKRGHSFGPFLPYTDFIFLTDLDAANVADPESLERLHERARHYAESRMKVPRALRYRVPNAVTVGVSAQAFSEEMVACARKSRHAVNSGEKNSVYLLDLTSGTVHSQGLERDPLRYGGSWVTEVNPSNRVAGLLVEAFARLAG